MIKIFILGFILGAIGAYLFEEWRHERLKKNNRATWLKDGQDFGKDNSLRNRYRCSRCGYPLFVERDEQVSMVPFCPGCGKDMRGKKDGQNH